jgi:hypothetical protein
MISSRVELIARRRLVQAFIDADFAMVTFSRAGAITKTAAGGKVRGPDTVIDEQKVAIVPAKRRYDPGVINSEAGSIMGTEYLLLGNYRLDVQENDEFLWLGLTYRIETIHPTRRAGGEPESILCAIVLKGVENG